MVAPKRCLVLGGSGTLGQVVCRVLAAQGSRVAFTYFSNENAATRLAEDLPGSLAYRLDARKVEEIEKTVAAAVAALGGLEALVHCMAVGVTTRHADPSRYIRLAEIDEAGWDSMLAINVKSFFFAARASLPHLKGGGNLVVIGSVDGEKPLPAPIHYAGSKAALSGLVRAMAKELGTSGIKVNLVAPGVMEKGLSVTLPVTLRKEYEKHCALNRKAQVPEIAQVIAWLALENTYITGQSILVDGAL